MDEIRKAFSKRLAQAMRDAGHEPRPSELETLFNSHYRGRSITFPSASRWLNGGSIPKPDKLELLAHLLGVKPEHLLFASKETKVAEPRIAWLADLKQQDREAVEHYLALSAQHRRLVRELIAALAT